MAPTHTKGTRTPRAPGRRKLPGPLGPDMNYALPVSMFRDPRVDAPRFRKTFVQSFARGLQVLECLNVNNGISVNAIARLTELNRAIVYRLVETLRLMGLVERDAEGAYWLADAVLALANGVHAETWIGTSARRPVEDLGRAVQWPLSLSVPSGLAMVLRFCTDRQSPFTIRKMPIGYRMSMPGTATGRAYLAMCAPETREQIVRMIAANPSFPEDGVASQRRRFASEIARIRERGFDVQEHPPITSLAVPVMHHGLPLGALCIRYFTSALSVQKARERYLAPLRETAALLAQGAARTL